MFDLDLQLSIDETSFNVVKYDGKYFYNRDRFFF